MKPRSKGYHLDCIAKLQHTWPELLELPLDEIKPQACKDWAAKLNAEISGQHFKNMIGTLRIVIDRGIRNHKEKTDIKLENPANELRRVKWENRIWGLHPSTLWTNLGNLRRRGSMARFFSGS